MVVSLAAAPKGLPYASLRATVTDGRTAGVFFRQTQLRRLISELLAARDDLLQAIQDDSGNTPTEAWVEFYLTVSGLKAYFDGLNPEQELQDEYRLARQQDAGDAREAVGIAYIQPDTHTYLYSVVTPVGAAIAAGNCALIVVEQTTRTLPPLLRKILRSALDPDTLEIVPTKVEDAAFLSTCVQVIQTGASSAPTTTVLCSPRHAPVVGVVDRTADVDKAAKALVSARFSFGGTSPYAPDVVLVHESVKKIFLHAAVRHAIQYLTEDHSVSTGRPRRSEKTDRNAAGESTGINIITSGSRGEILEVTERTALNKQNKVGRRALYVHSVTSVDDAIDLANDYAGTSSRALAAYVFGAPDTCKYLSQFIAAHTTFANHIPCEILVGPGAPAYATATPSTRYPVAAFTIPRPAFANASAQSAELEAVLSQTDAKLLAQEQQRLAKTLVPPPERPVKHLIGFFEQGIITGLGTAATPVLLALGTAGYYGVTRVILPLFRH